MCARKVASISGDIRRALMICRRAAEICEREELSTVTMDLIHKAAKELSTTHTIQVIITVLNKYI